MNAPVVDEMAYAAAVPGMPGFGAVTVDLPARRREIAIEVAAWIRRGWTVQRVTIEAARAGMGEYIDAMVIEKMKPPQVPLL